MTLTHLLAPRWRLSVGSLGLLAAVALLAILARGFQPWITDQYAFRQTQTAIVAQYLHGVGDLFTGELPVFGSPWSVPFEFPLYQALVKSLSVATGLELNTCGRLVSVGFFLMALACLARLCRQFDVRHPVLVCSLVALTPLYVFWSRSFMIETTAVAFMLWFATIQVDVYRDRELNVRRAAWLLVAGVAAILVKVTTLLPVLALALAFQAFKAWRSRHARETVVPALLPLMAQGAVLAVGAAWVKYSDLVKARNPLAEGLTSHSLQSWNWGTLHQRLDPHVWFVLLAHTAGIFFPPEIVSATTSSLAVRAAAFLFPDEAVVRYGNSLALFAALTLAFVAAFGRCSPQRKRLVGLCLGLFLLPYLCFINLHFVHTYYQCANAIFLCTALGLAFEGAIAGAGRPGQAWLWLGGYALGLLLLADCALRTMDWYAAQPERDAALAAKVREASAPGKAVIITGQDWSSQTPYQSGHRALMLWAPRSAPRAQAALDIALRQRADYDLYLACGRRPPYDDLFRQTWGLDPAQKPLAEVEGCRLYRLGAPPGASGS